MMDWTTRAMIQLHCSQGEEGCNRLILADRLDDVGRTIEAQFLRLTNLPCVHLCGLLSPGPLIFYADDQSQRHIEDCCMLQMWKLNLLRMNQAIVLDSLRRFRADGWQLLEYVAREIRRFEREALPIAASPLDVRHVRSTANLIYAVFKCLRNRLPLCFDLYHLCTI